MQISFFAFAQSSGQLSQHDSFRQACGGRVPNTGHKVAHIHARSKASPEGMTTHWSGRASPKSACWLWGVISLSEGAHLRVAGQQLQERVSSATDVVPSSVRQEVQDQVNEAARQLTDALPTPDQVQMHGIVPHQEPKGVPVAVFMKTFFCATPTYS